MPPISEHNIRQRLLRLTTRPYPAHGHSWLPDLVRILQEMNEAKLDAEDVSGGGVLTEIRDEVPAGGIDGSNAQFITNRDFIPGTIEVFMNGVKLRPIADFNTSGTRLVSLMESPTPGEQITVNYSSLNS